MPGPFFRDKDMLRVNLLIVQKILKHMSVRAYLSHMAHLSTGLRQRDRLVQTFSSAVYMIFRGRDSFSRQNQMLYPVSKIQVQGTEIYDPHLQASLYYSRANSFSRSLTALPMSYAVHIACAVFSATSKRSNA